MPAKSERRKSKRQPLWLPREIKSWKTLDYFFSSYGGGVGETGGGGGGVVFGSSRIPCLNSLMPVPKPRISSGILRPPNKITTMIRINNKCIGLSSIKPPNNTRFSSGHPHLPLLRRSYLVQSITRSLPTRRVNRSRSRYSSRGIAYFRVTWVSSLNAAIGSRSPFFFLYEARSALRCSTALL